MSAELVDLTKLSPADKLRLLGELWDDLCQCPDELPVTDWQRAELDRRKSATLQNPDAGEPWELVRDRLRRGQS